MTPSQPQLKYTYFDGPGRGEPCRLALVIGKLDFIDDRVTFAQFPAIKPTLPLGSLPILEIDNSIKVAQTTAILRYIGRITNLYPGTVTPIGDTPNNTLSADMQALYIDQIIDTIADFFLGLFKYNGSDKDELRKARETALSVGAKRYWGGMERLIGDIPGSEEGPFVLGKTVSIADAAIAGLYNLLSVEYLEFVPADALDGYERAKKVHDAVMNLPEVENYYEKHPLAKLS